MNPDQSVRRSRGENGPQPTCLQDALAVGKKPRKVYVLWTICARSGSPSHQWGLTEAKTTGEKREE